MARMAVIALVAGALLSGWAKDGFRWRIDAADEMCRPPTEEAESMGGLAWVSNDVYWAVTDEKSRTVLWELELPVARDTGKIGGCRLRMMCRVEGTVDVEGLVRDPLDGSAWLADERAGTITQHDPATGRMLAGRVQMPETMKDIYRDSGLESLTISRDGLTMWPCTEEALKTDGARASRENGTDVRLTRFARSSAAANWKAIGQWVYRTDSVAGRPWYGKKRRNLSRSGISELCLLDDGTLLVLEREFSVVMIPRLRCRIYETDLTGAEDVCGRKSLLDGGKAPTLVEKRLLHEVTGLAMYEGMCIGPTLTDGSRLLVLVSDGDMRTLQSVLTLRLAPLK